MILKDWGNLQKNIKDYYEPEGTIKERLTEINMLSVITTQLQERMMLIW